MADFDGGCVSSCRHNLWGGNGTCTIVQADPIEYECSCGDGYISEDSLGSPSCVQKGALVALYTALNIDVCQQQSKPQEGLRLRLIYSASAYCGSASVVFLVAAAHGTLYRSGMLYAMYCVIVPCTVVVLGDIMEIWVDTLPSQLLPADSIAIKVMKLAEEKRVFVWVGRVGSVGLAAFGIPAFFFLKAATVARSVNAISGMSAACGLVCFNFVGFRLTSIISNGKRQASPSAHAFYDGAILTLRIQVAVMSAITIFWTAAIVALEPQLGGFGARTPILPLSVMVFDGYVGVILSVHFAKVGSTKGASPIASRMRAARAIISDVEAKFGRSMVFGKSAILPVPGEKRVVPTIS